jgi:hypothetical protein
VSAFPVLYYTEGPRTCTLHLPVLCSTAAANDLHLDSCARQIFIQQEGRLISFQHGVNYVLASCSFPSAVCKHQTTAPCQLRRGLSWQLHCFQHRLRRTAVNKSGTVQRCNLLNCLIFIVSRIYHLSMACSTFPAPASETGFLWSPTSIAPTLFSQGYSQLPLSEAVRYNTLQI